MVPEIKPGLTTNPNQMTKIITWTVLVLSVATVLFYGGVRYGRSHRSLHERMEYIWENGGGYARGWAECEAAYGIQMVNDGNGFQGWICSRFNTNMPPKYHELVNSHGHYKP